MMLTVFAGIAAFGRSLFQTRTSAGRGAAAERGVRFGRPPKLGPDQLALARRLIDEGTPVREMAKRLNVHMATLYRALDVPLLSGMSATHLARSGVAPQPQPKIRRTDPQS